MEVRYRIGISNQLKIKIESRFDVARLPKSVVRFLTHTQKVGDAIAPTKTPPDQETVTARTERNHGYEYSTHQRSSLQISLILYDPIARIIWSGNRDRAPREGSEVSMKE